MKIELELPDWAEERSIYVMAGIELVAYRLDITLPWQVKTGRCNRCGKCCTGLKSHSQPLVNGRCVFLHKEPGDNERYECAYRLNRPFGCCIGRPSNMEDCTESFAEVK